MSAERGRIILGVNIDHVATVRQARLGDEPDPVIAAGLAVLNGADGITLHVREDRRHVNDRDLELLRRTVTVELNLEMAATPEMLKIAVRTRPDLVTIVPEKRAELTTEGGLDLKASRKHLEKAVLALRKAGIPVSFFINPDEDDVERSRAIGADMVEIHTGAYANARAKTRDRELLRVQRACRAASAAGLLVNAGHGLNYANVAAVACIEGLRGLYIGHSIISRAVLVGIGQAVRDMKALISC